MKQAKEVSYSYIHILEQKPVLLYLIPWIMFSVINNLEAPILENFFGPDLSRSMCVVELAFSSLFVLVGGFFADLVGRKRVAVAGFVALGIAYATLGFFPDMPIFQWFYSIIGAVAWGMFTTVFLMTIWGDLSQSAAREKYYAIGGMPFLLSGVIPLLTEPYSKEISVYTAFSLASFFLFLAVLPLMYAPETLPEEKIRLRELRKYVEKAKKKVEEEHEGK